MRRWLPFLFVVALLASSRPARAEEAAEPLYCPGEYADDLGALTHAARAFDDKSAPFTYCVRTTAVYECPSYAADGSLRRTRTRAVAHGTAFGYRQESGGTLLLTNQHVAEWPVVTDDDHVVPDVPVGCRRVSEELKIVDDEGDAYDRDDIPLTSVVSDPQLDVAVLRAKVALPVIPWRVGHSAGLRERNAVDVRGFPLGALRANNVGKVVSALDHDEQGEWDHDDFVIDALLSKGNSGSPVLAISCRTGEFELVGVYHAQYTQGSALNVVVGIDQVRDLMTTLRRAPRPPAPPALLASADRKALLEFARATPASWFPLGRAVAAVHARADGALVFEVEGHDFPVDPSPKLVLEDLASRAPASFGTLGRVWAGNRQGLRQVERRSVDADTLHQLSHLLETLREAAVASMRYTQALRAGIRTRERFKQVTRLEKTLRRASGGQADVSQAALDLADRLCPASVEATATVAVALATPPVPRATVKRGEQLAAWHPDLLRAGVCVPLLSDPAPALGPLQ